MMIWKWKGATLQAAQSRQVDWWTHMQSSTNIRSCALMRKTRTYSCEEVYCWPQKERSHARGGRVENPWWKLKKKLYGRRKCRGGVEQCPDADLRASPRKTTSTCQEATWRWHGSRNIWVQDVK